MYQIEALYNISLHFLLYFKISSTNENYILGQSVYLQED